MGVCLLAFDLFHPKSLQPKKEKRNLMCQETRVELQEKELQDLKAADKAVWCGVKQKSSCNLNHIWVLHSVACDTGVGSQSGPHAWRAR